MAAAFEATADVSRFSEAIDHHLKRVVITPEHARTLDDRAKQEAFWVSGGLQVAQIQRVFDALTKSIESGETFADFKKRIAGDLTNAAHAETVYRNAVQRAYNAGRYAQMTEPSTAKFRPYWLFDAINDPRVTKLICLPRDKTLLPLDHPFWDTAYPPLHHRCRSSVRNLRRSEAEKRGITQTPHGDPVPGGWGLSPRLYTGPIKPTPAKTDPALLAELNRKAPAGEKKRRPATKAEHTAKHWQPSFEPKYGKDAAKSLASGRASYERGLDMTVAQAREQLRKVDAPGFVAMRDALQDTDATRTLREQAAELDPLKKAATAAAGHLAALKPRTAIAQTGLSKLPGGQRGMDRMTALTGTTVQTADEHWIFSTTTIKNAGGASAIEKRLVYDPTTEGVLEHELGHLIEDLNPELNLRSEKFLAVRVTGETLKPRGKQHGEVILAWDDQFLHWYTGRNYERPDGTLYGTEITSTALELLIAGERFWGTLEDMARVDFEHLLFLLGQLAGP